MIDAPVHPTSAVVQSVNVDVSIWRSLALNMDGAQLAVAGYAATSSPVAPPTPPAPVPSPSPSPDPTPVDVPPTPDPTPTPSPVSTPTPTPDPTPTPSPTPDPNPAPAASPSPTSPAPVPTPAGQPGSPDSGDQNTPSPSSSAPGGQPGADGTSANTDGTSAPDTSAAGINGAGAGPTTPAGSVLNTLDIPRQAATAQLDRGIGWSQDQLEGPVATSTSAKPVSKTATTTRMIRVPAKKPADLTTTVLTFEATVLLAVLSALRFVIGDPILFYPSLFLIILLTGIKLYYFFQLPKTVEILSSAPPPTRDTFS